MLDRIVVQMSRVNRENGYYFYVKVPTADSGLSVKLQQKRKKMSLSKFKLESWPVVVVVVVVLQLNSARPKTTPSPDFKSGLHV